MVKMEEIKEWSKLPINPGKIFEEPRKTKILLIAWNVHPGKDFAQIFDQMDNVELTWIGTDDPDTPCYLRPDLNLKNFPVRQFIYNGPFGSIPLAIREFKLTSLLDMFGYDFDLILHLQDWTIFTDKVKSPIPYIYIHSEAFYPEVPFCAWKVIGSTQFELDFLRRKYGSRFKYDYLPFALRTDLIRHDVNEKKRTIKGSFAGELFHFDQMYNDRREIVQYLEKAIPNDFQSHYLGPYGKNPEDPREILAGKGRLCGKEYTELLLKTQIGLNIPTGDNCNFRDFEVPGLGALLLTRESTDLKQLGFKDGENCIYYKTKEEAEEVIKNGYDPEIAQAGYLHVITNHTYFKRMHELTDMMREYCKVEI